MHASYIWQLYLYIAILCMLYATDVFLTPQQNIGKRMKDGQSKQPIVNKLASIQSRAAIMITGAMKLQ